MQLSRRARVGLSHAAVSAILVGALWAFVLFVWYPGVIARLEGVWFILLMLAAVDVGLGPGLTLIIASPSKPRRELMRDVGVIALVQISALVYATYSIYTSRPAFVVYNKDRFDIVTPSELVWRPDEMPSAQVFRSAPVLGPAWVQALPPASLEKRNELLLSATIGGPDLKNLPHLFHPFPTNRDAIRERAKPVDALTRLGEAQRKTVLDAISAAGEKPEDVLYVPLLGRQATGVVLLRRSDMSVVKALAVTPVY